MAINPIDHPIIFEIPQLEAPSDWIEHVPFGMLLIDLARPRSIVELGVKAGVSYCAFCQAVKRLKITARCYAIDPWSGYERGVPFGDEVLDTLKQHHNPRYGEFSQLIKSTFDAAVGMFSDGSIDLLHLNAYQTREAVGRDFTTWLPKMSDRGIVLVHDIAERHQDFSVWRFWEEITQRYPYFEFTHGHGLGLVCVGSSVPAGIQQLLDCTDEQKDTLRTLCQERGSQLRAMKCERQAAPSASPEQTSELLNLREQQAVQRERRSRAWYESQIQILVDRSREQTARLNELNWTESSRGVKTIKLARATRYLLQREGPFHTARRILMWLSGRRGYGSSEAFREPAVLRSARRPDTAATSADLTPSLLTANQADYDGLQRRDLLRYLNMMSVMSSLLSPRTHRRSVTEPIISVIVRTVDRPETLRLALTSLANQTVDSFEVVVVCDAGPDIQYLLEDFSPYLSIHYVHKAEPIGRSEALNVGVAHATGKYISYLDDDDIVYPTHLETLLNTIMEGKEGETFAYVDYNRALVTLVSDHTATVSRVPVATWNFDYDSLLTSNFLPIHTWLHDKKVWEEVGGFATDMDMMEDWDFLIRIAQRRSFLAASRITCEYRFYLTRADSLVANRPRTLAGMETIYIRYPASDVVEAQRIALTLTLRDQVAAGKRILDSLEDDGQVPEPVVRQLLADIAGFVD